MKRFSIALVIVYAFSFLFSCTPFPKPSVAHCLKLDGMQTGKLTFSVNEDHTTNASQKKFYPKNYVIQVFWDAKLDNLQHTIYLARTKDWTVPITLDPTHKDYCILVHKDPTVGRFKQIGWSEENVVTVAGLIPAADGTYYASTSRSLPEVPPISAKITSKAGKSGDGVKVLLD